MTEQPQFTGAIVLKAKSRAEVEALAEQLRAYAEFGEVFSNRYEGGYAVKGQVRVVPLDGAPESTLLEAQIRDQAAQIGQLEQQMRQLEMERDAARRSAKQAHGLLQLLTPTEHLRLIDRNIAREHPGLWPNEDAVDGEDSPASQAFAALLLDAAARTIEEQGPDDVHVTLRAAERCAAIVRGLQAITKEEELKP